MADARYAGARREVTMTSRKRQADAAQRVSASSVIEKEPRAMELSLVAPLSITPSGHQADMPCTMYSTSAAMISDWICLRVFSAVCGWAKVSRESRRSALGSAPLAVKNCS